MHGDRQGQHERRCDEELSPTGQPVSSSAPIATNKNAIGLALPAAWNRA